MKIKTLDSVCHSPAAFPAGARVAFCLLLAGLSPAFADMNDGTGTTTTTPSPTLTNDSRPPSGELSRGDRRFIKKAAKLGEREVALSRAAGKHATDARVRAFADEMVGAHSKANEEIAALARRKGVVLEPADATERRAEDKKWAEKKADDFDDDYLDAIIDAHQDTVDVLENGVDSKDADIAALAKRLLPEVKSHLHRAEALEDGLK